MISQRLVNFHPRERWSISARRSASVIFYRFSCFDPLSLVGVGRVSVALYDCLIISVSCAEGILIDINCNWISPDTWAGLGKQARVSFFHRRQLLRDFHLSLCTRVWFYYYHLHGVVDVHETSGEKFISSTPVEAISKWSALYLNRRNN